MQQNFSDFLRHGGNGQYVLSHLHRKTFGQKLGFSLKSAFPNYSALGTVIEYAPDMPDGFVIITSYPRVD